MTNPNFPNRPDHPDFWLMAEAVQDLDTASDDGIAFQRIIGDVDTDSLMYMGQQRALRVRQLQPSWASREAAFAAVWMDAFVIGARFRKIKDERA